MENFKCAMCKNTFPGKPALRNAAGVFCLKCKREIRERVVAGMPQWDGLCPWCGCKINEKNRCSSGGDHEKHVCKTCDSNRSWLLTCIRHSEKAAKYVERIEEREAPQRQERAKKQADEAEQVKPQAPQQNQHMTPDDIAKVVAAVMNELLK